MSMDKLNEIALVMGQIAALRYIRSRDEKDCGLATAKLALETEIRPDVRRVLKARIEERKALEEMAKERGIAFNYFSNIDRATLINDLRVRIDLETGEAGVTLMMKGGRR